jgi:hypothetical protein
MITDQANLADVLEETLYNLKTQSFQSGNYEIHQLGPLLPLSRKTHLFLNFILTFFFLNRI